MGNLAENLAGKFIVLDGPDGSGKTTQLRLLAEHLTERGADVEVVMDPGTTKIGQKIRALLLDRDNGEIGPLCETMLFMASRAQLVAEKVRPALAGGKVVLCDRFISATAAYQGASGVDAAKILTVGDVAVGGLWPDLTIILDMAAGAGLARVGRRAGQADAGDRMETRPLDYHEAVRRNFAALAGTYPGPVVCVPADADKQTVFKRVLAELARAFGG